MTLSLALILALTVLQTPVAPQSAPQAPAPSEPTQLAPVTVTGRGTPNASEDDQRLVCRTQAVVGTNRRQRVCMTVAQRNEQRAASLNIRDRLEGAVNPAAADNNLYSGRAF